MHKVKLRKVGNSMTITLPANLVSALHLQENDEVAVEAQGERIVVTRANQEFQAAWAAYKAVEPGFRNANRALVE